MQTSEETEKEKEELRLILPQEGRALYDLGGSLLGCLSLFFDELKFSFNQCFSSVLDFQTLSRTVPAAAHGPQVQLL